MLIGRNAVGGRSWKMVIGQIDVRRGDLDVGNIDVGVWRIGHGIRRGGGQG